LPKVSGGNGGFCKNSVGFSMPWDRHIDKNLPHNIYIYSVNYLSLCKPNYMFYGKHSGKLKSHQGKDEEIWTCKRKLSLRKPAVGSVSMFMRA
jgi:hypothetical protein